MFSPSRWTALLALALLTASLNAAPSSIFWTNCTTEFQETGTASLSVTDYFTVFNRRHHGSSLPTDVGLLFGLFTWNDIQAEAGIDFYGDSDDPLYFNAKVGVAENILFCNAPAVNVGIFNIGTRRHGSSPTNQNVVDFIFGKTLPDALGGGSIYGAFYSGGRALGKDRQGYMVAWYQAFCHTTDSDGTEYDKWVLCADYTSGNNAIGGGGVAACYYFTPNVYVETGPVWFNSAVYNGSWKWGVQLYISFPTFKIQ